MARETLGEVGDGLADPSNGPGRVRRPSGRSGMVWRTLLWVRDGSGEPRGDPGRFGGPSGEVWDVSGDPPGGLGQV